MSSRLRPRPIGRVIARRELRQLKPKKKLILELGVPKRDRGAWACPVRVRGLLERGGERVHWILGEDSVQALDLAMQFARTLLEPNDNVLWFDLPVRDLFSRPIPNWGDVKAYRRLIRLVEEESAAYERRYWKRHPGLKKTLGQDLRTTVGRANRHSAMKANLR
jgi:hypothetical protein